MSPLIGSVGHHPGQGDAHSAPDHGEEENGKERGRHVPLGEYFLPWKMTKIQILAER